jgi:hypothetical protein
MPRFPRLTAFLSLLLLAPLFLRDVELVPDGRRVGGSMWFVAPTRGEIQAYDSGRPEPRFAEKVRGWTTRSTGVLRHRAFETLVPEPRFDATLDRELVTGVSSPAIPGDKPWVRGGWVFLGIEGAVSPATFSLAAGSRRRP